MKKRKVLQIISILICVMLLLPSCNLRKKSETRKTTEAEEEEEEKEPEDTQAPEDEQPAMKVESLDQFISDGSVFAENVPIPTPTPIPVNQVPLGMTNDMDGYYSGPLENATIIDNQYFRYTIFSCEVTDTSYIVTGEFENKTDIPFSIKLKSPVMDNEDTDSEFYTNVLEPHTVMEDVTDFASVFTDYYSGVEPTRISFLLLAISATGDFAAISAPDPNDPTNEVNYIPVNIFPQGEDMFIYQHKELYPDSTIIYDSDGALFAIDYYEVNDFGGFEVHYTFVNKTTNYIQLKLTGGIDNTGAITLDSTVFECGHQSIYIAPFSSQSGKFSVTSMDLSDAGIDPLEVSSVSIPLIANSLNDGIKILWQNTIKQEVQYG